MIYVGTAAWSIPKIAASHFPDEGSHLERYSKILNAVEINSSFYKDHQPKTYKRWHESTPLNFKFSVKLNQRFTHDNNLSIDQNDLIENLKGILELGDKLGALLLQFPKSQKFSSEKMEIFFQTIREVYSGPIALEARNMGWMERDSVELITKYNVSKVDADPEKCPVNLPGEIKYFRLHGSPEIYKSDYSIDYLENLYDEMKTFKGDVWCIFDNTTFGYATNNAIEITNRIKGETYERHPRLHGDRATSMHTIDQY